LITTNQNPEQVVRDQIDKMLLACGWVVQSKNQINLAANTGVAVREYQTDRVLLIIFCLYIKNLLVL
jgi:type I restriction enzyme R subunit